MVTFILCWRRTLPAPRQVEQGWWIILPVPRHLGQGDVDFGAYLKALEDIGYRGYLTIEREVGEDPAADIRLAADYLRSFYK